MDFDRLRNAAAELAAKSGSRAPHLGIEVLTRALDLRYPTGSKKRSAVLTILRDGLEKIFEQQPLFDDARESPCRRITWETRGRLRPPQKEERTLLIDARGFAAQGADCDARLAVDAYALGWRHLIHYNSRGTRFHAAGFGPIQRRPAHRLL